MLDKMVRKYLVILLFVLFLNYFWAMDIHRYFKAFNNLNWKIVPEIEDFEELDYKGPDIEIACIHEDKMTDYTKIRTCGKDLQTIASILKENKKDLVIYFDNILGGRAVNEGLHWNFHNELFRKTGKNVCIFSYGFGKDSDHYMDLLPKVKKMVNTHRIEFVARIARDFVIALGLALKRIFAIGFCFGAHIASHFCCYCNRAKNEIIGGFIGVEPTRISYYLDIDRYPQLGDALFVQLIHANYNDECRLFRMGTSRINDGDIDILVDGLPRGREHVYCLYITMATAIQVAVLTAHKYGSVHQGSEHYTETQSQIKLDDDEIFFGMHAVRDASKLGLFRIYMSDEGQRLNASIAHLRPTRDDQKPHPKSRK